MGKKESEVSNERKISDRPDRLDEGPNVWFNLVEFRSVLKSRKSTENTGTGTGR